MLDSQSIANNSTQPPIDEALIQEITRKIVDAFHPKRVILFGSRARGDYHADSDIDLLVEMESTEKRWQRRVRIGSLFKDRWWPMDLLVYTPQEIEVRRNSFATVIPYALKEGKILYESADGA